MAAGGKAETVRRAGGRGDGGDGALGDVQQVEEGFGVLEDFGAEMSGGENFEKLGLGKKVRHYLGEESKSGSTTEFHELKEKVISKVLDSLFAWDEFHLNPEEVEAGEIDSPSLRDRLKVLSHCSPILVTGSSGYLGTSLVRFLRRLSGVIQEDGKTESNGKAALEVIGIDIAFNNVDGEPEEEDSECKTTDYLVDITELTELDVVFKKYRPKAVFHTAGLHAPNALYYSEEDFQKVNFKGTKNLVQLCEKHETKYFVFSSTTSLMISQRLKDFEGGSDPVEADATVVLLNEESVSVFDLNSPAQLSQASSEKHKAFVENSENTATLRSQALKHRKEDRHWFEPRNKYGRSKNATEIFLKSCMSQQTGLKICILRCSRFFAEDAYATKVLPNVSNSVFKAYELFRGVRCSLQDMILAQVTTLERLSTLNSESESVWGPFIVSARSPLVSLCVPEAQEEQSKNTSKSRGVSWLLERSKQVATESTDLENAADWRIELKEKLRVYDSRKLWNWLRLPTVIDYQFLLEGLANQPNSLVKERLGLMSEGNY